MNAPIVRTSPRAYAQLPRVFRWFSNHCVLRQLDAADGARVWRASQHDAFAGCWSDRAPASEADLQRRIEAAHHDWNRGKRYAMAVLRKGTHEFVAWMELSALPARGEWRLDGYIDPSCIDTTLAREAVSAPLELLQTAFDATRVLARCAGGAAPFARALRSAGFGRSDGTDASAEHTTYARRLGAAADRGLPFDDLIDALRPDAALPRRVLALV